VIVLTVGSWNAFRQAAIDSLHAKLDRVDAEQHHCFVELSS
jgi:hypothetical protein